MLVGEVELEGGNAFTRYSHQAENACFLEGHAALQREVDDT